MVATRFVVDQTGPASLAMLRYAIGVCCLLPPLLVAARVRFEGRDLLAIAALGIGQFGVLIALLNYGLRTVPAARAALIFATFPLLTLVVAAALGRERLTAAKLGGVLLTIGGVAAALSDKAAEPVRAVAVAAGAATAAGVGVEPAGLAAAAPAGLAVVPWIGEAAVFASAFVGAVCSVLYRPYVRKYPTVPVSALAMLASVAFLAVFAAGEGFFHATPRITPVGWAAVIFIGVSSGVGYSLWLWALAHATPTRVTVFLSLSPLTAAILGALLLGEPISLAVLSGLALVALGLGVAHARAD